MTHAGVAPPPSYPGLVSTIPEHPAPDQPADDVELRQVIDPGQVRRAPRYQAFFVVGVLVGVILGLALGLYLLDTFDPSRDQPLSKPGVWLAVLILGTTTVTTLLAGLAATVLDRRSIRRQGAKRAV